MIPRQHKNKLLIVSGIGDTYFSPESRRKVTRGIEVADKITQLIKDRKDDYYGVVNLTVGTEYWNKVNPFVPVKDTRLINIILNSNKFLEVSNEISLKDSQTKETLLFNGNEFDFLFPSEDFEIHICGLDFNGVYQPLIKELLERGYKIYLYSDMIKRFAETKHFISGLRNRNFEYCSHKTALV